MSATPREGSITARAIDHLRSLPARGESTSSVIADMIGSDSTTVGACLAPYVRSGTVATRKEGRRVFFRIGSGTPPARDEEDDDPPLRKASADAPPDHSNSSIFAKAGAVPHPTTWAQPARAPRKKAAAPPPKPPRKKPGRKPAKATRLIPVPPSPAAAPLAADHKPELGVALSNRGELFLEPVNGTPMRLSCAETQDLLAYLLKLDQLATPAARRIT